MDLILWGLGLIPWWLYVVAAAIALLLTMPYWTPLWALTPGWLKTVILTLGGGFIAYQMGRNRQAELQREKEARTNAQVLNKKMEIEHEVQQMPDSAVTDELRRSGWLRE